MSIALTRDFWIYLIVTFMTLIIGVYFLTQELVQDQILVSLFWIVVTLLSLSLLVHGIGEIKSSTYITAVALYLLILIVSLIWISAPDTVGPMLLLVMLNLLLYLILDQNNYSRSCLTLAILVIWFGLILYVLMYERQLS